MARAYFSRAAARGSSPEPACCWCRVWELASEARAIACGKVLGWGLAEGGAVRAAWASAGDVAEESRVTFSETVRPRSWKVSLMFGG
jgi:hypothetical protein